MTQITAIGLIRVSTEEQAADGGGGMPRQREAILNVARQNNLLLVRIDEIIDVSGTNVQNSPIFQRILQDVRGKNADGVIVAEMDRLVRPDSFSSFDILDSFRESGAKIWTEKTIYDPATPVGFFQSLILGGVAGLERSTILARTQGAKEAKRKMGQCPSADITLPTGVSYNRKAGQWSYTPEVEAVKEAFRVVDEEGLTNMQKIGIRVGIKPRTLSNLLQNPIFKGWRIYDKKRGKAKYSSVDGKQADRKKILRDENEIIRIRVFDEGAVSEARFDRVQVLLADVRTRWRSSRQTVEINPLSGIAICAKCGLRIYSTSGKRKNGVRQAYYICRQNYYLNKRKGMSCKQKSIGKEDLEETAYAFVSDYLTSPEVIEQIAERLQYAAADTASTGQFTQMQNDLYARKNRLLDAVEIGAVPYDEIVGRLNEISKKETAIKNMMADAEHRQRTAEDSERILERLIRGSRAFRRQLSKDEKRKLLQAMFGSLSFDDCSIVDFVIHPSFLELTGGNFPSSCTNNGTRSCRDSSRRRA